MFSRHRTLVQATLGLLLLATPAFAGPPLLCHPFDIGTAASLPWDGTNSWFHGRADYPLTALVQDTERILQPATPVIVRMETLRRAAIYASADPAVARTLLEHLRGRTAKTPAPDALVLGDAAYFAEALRQISMLRSMPEFAQRVDAIRAIAEPADARGWMGAAVAARPTDASIAFEAALVTSMFDRRTSAEQAAKARAGASADPLLARNLAHLN